MLKQEKKKAEQELHDLDVAHQRGKVGGRLAVGAGHVRLGPVVEEDLDQVNGLALNGLLDDWDTEAVDAIGACTLLKEVLDDLEGVVLDGAGQRRLALHVLNPDVGTSLDQSADDISGLGDLSGAVQRRRLLDVLCVDVCAVLEKHIHQLY
ncbi:unnamed protein product [Clonostachys rosea]|uniref:Uncharacterized protein n=1 Tax=Bionectria ochroleuca TaxID=29856 RepID=A0ABY6ULN5_BIOOC|nr:unnamed protein product [Clonostachys rosea]